MMDKGYGKPIQINPAQIEKKLQILTECGLKLVPPYSSKDILRLCEKADEDVLTGYTNSLEKDTLRATLFLLGKDYKDYNSNDYEYGRCYCENLLLTEFESYNDYEDYLDVIKRMVKMTQGALKLDNMTTWYDDYDDKVWISFDFQGETHEFSYEYKKWFRDVGILTPIVKFLAIADPTKTFVYYNYCDEVYAIICINKADVEKLKKQRIYFQPVSRTIW